MVIVPARGPTFCARGGAAESDGGGTEDESGSAERARRRSAARAAPHVLPASAPARGPCRARRWAPCGCECARRAPGRTREPWQRTASAQAETTRDSQSFCRRKIKRRPTHIDQAQAFVPLRLSFGRRQRRSAPPPGPCVCVFVFKFKRPGLPPSAPRLFIPPRPQAQGGGRSGSPERKQDERQRVHLKNFLSTFHRRVCLEFLPPDKPRRAHSSVQAVSRLCRVISAPPATTHTPQSSLGEERSGKQPTAASKVWPSPRSARIAPPMLPFGEERLVPEAYSKAAPGESSGVWPTMPAVPCLRPVPCLLL